jgi:hypothetical protein
MLSTRLRLLAIGAGTAMTLTIATALPALAANATATLTGAGSPALLSSVPPTWTLTLDGLDHNSLANSGTPSTVDVNDATGTGSGWNITLSGAVLTSGSHTLGQPTTASAASFVCDSGSTCTAPTSNTTPGTQVTYPFTVGVTAAKFYSANASTGLGRMTGTSTWTINVPASAFAGTYSGAWTYSIVSGP